MFDGTEGALISETSAVTIVGNYRSEYGDEVKGLFLGRDILEELLDQEGAMGIRFYLAISNGNFTIVGVAADEDEDDIIGKIADSAVPCPPRCSSTGSFR